jgi:hypothetical protein
MLMHTPTSPGTHMQVRACARAPTHARTHRPVSNTYCLSTATIIRERAWILTSKVSNRVLVLQSYTNGHCFISQLTSHFTNAISRDGRQGSIASFPVCPESGSTRLLRCIAVNTGFLLTIFQIVFGNLFLGSQQRVALKTHTVYPTPEFYTISRSIRGMICDGCQIK